MSPQAKTPGTGCAVVGREDVAVGQDVAVGIEVELAVKHVRVGDVADAEEHERDGQFAALAGLGVAELEALDVLLFDPE